MSDSSLYLVRFSSSQKWTVEGGEQKTVIRIDENFIKIDFKIFFFSINTLI